MKIFGVGTDIVQHARIKKIVEAPHYRRFIQKVLHPNEIIQIESFQSPNKKVEFLASRWAAKESLVKASSQIQLIFPQIEIIKVDNKPMVKMHELNTKIMQSIGVNEIHLSISHEDDYSLAFVILCK